eukprot:TRINITY_DN1516_c0_g1_i13.p1 TRINITY_DN1516_c0_g1~~TRINITY_DN1516_c0_g1_i13.p1  ORF type:complete len:389 (+),score=130.21 TRINITY_DN1516_c0_g1_i13:100-1266(+)
MCIRDSINAEYGALRSGPMSCGGSSQTPAMPGKRNPKFQPIATKERKSGPAPPLDVRVKKFCRQNKPLVVAAAALLLSLILMWFFGRSRAAGKFASSQGLEFSSSADYKLPKKLSAFETLSRGSKAYAFNIMSGDLAYEGGTAQVSGFDFSYTESKAFAVKKRVSKSDKVHELTAMMFSKAALGIKSLTVSPRNMVLDADDAPRQYREATVLKPGDSGDCASCATPWGLSPGFDLHQAQAPDTLISMTKDEPAPEAAAEEAAPEEEEVVEEEAEAAQEEEPELDVLSSKFNSTFVVETIDVDQTTAVLSPGLKKLLLKQPDFFVDFQDDRFLVYREFTFENQDYSNALELGKQILAELNREIPGPTPGVDLGEAPTVFVSRSKLADDS